MLGGAFHCPSPSTDQEALKEYALAMFSGDNLPWKFEGELPSDIAEGLVEAWAEYAPQNLVWMKDLDPDFDAVEERGAAFQDFPGAPEGVTRFYEVYTLERSTIETDVRRTIKKPIKKRGAFYTCLLMGLAIEISIFTGEPGRESL